MHGQVRDRAGHESNLKSQTFFIIKNFTLEGSFIPIFFRGSKRSEVFAVVLKVLKCVCLGIMGISSVWKESRCASLDCTAGSLSPALLQFQSLCCQPSPESGAAPSAWGTPLKPGRHIYSGLWVRQSSRPSFHSLRTACQTASLHKPHLMPRTFN